jgi:hypothetical protein
MRGIPPRITNFYFVSDQEAGVPFAFSDVREEDGA